MTPLFSAIYSKNTKEVRRLLAAGADPNEQYLDDDKTTVLQAAAQGEAIEIVEMLLKAGADPNLTSADGGTALLSACNQADPAITNMLIKAGASVTATYTDRDTISPIMIAAKFGSLHIVRLLMEHGADINYRSHFGVTPLHFAMIEKDQPEFVQELLALGANTNARTNNGSTPLDYAVKSNMPRTKAAQVLRQAMNE